MVLLARASYKAAALNPASASAAHTARLDEQQIVQALIGVMQDFWEADPSAVLGC